MYSRVVFYRRYVLGESEDKARSQPLNPTLEMYVRCYFETDFGQLRLATLRLRKGAVRAEKDELLIIPMNMRDGSLICRGKGNADWLCSAPHGAGRLMSRKKAKETLTMQEFSESMNGIYTTSVCESTLDEAPMVYKPMEEIIECIEPTVDVIDVIKPIYNFKAK